MTTPTATPDQNAPMFNIQRIYTKDVSLETPNVPQIFREQGEVSMDLELNLHHEELQPNVYEAALRATITGKSGEKTLFLLEVTQAGIFELRNIPKDQEGILLYVNCPFMLSPYLRAFISDALQRATLPPFILPEVNWNASYAEQQQELAKGA